MPANNVLFSGEFGIDEKQTVNVTYVSASETAGSVSNENDTIQIITADGLTGSTAIAKENYAFAGWYKDNELVSMSAILDTETIKNYLNVSKETGTYEATEFIAHWKGLEVTKEATSAVDSEGNAKDVTKALSLGDTVTYTITVKNIGTVSLSNIVVSDEMAGVQLTQESSWEIASLGAGEVSAPIKVTYTIQESDLGKTLVNVATATVKEDSDVPVKLGEESNETDDPNPSFTATKSIASDQQESTFGVGDTVTFAITVENTGNVTLNNVTVGEELTDAVIERGTGYSVDNNVATVTTLAPGKNVVVYAKYVVKQTDVDDADLVNTATVNAKDPEGKDLEEEKPSVEVPTDEQAPGMVAEKEIANPEAATGKDGKFKVGDTVEFNITVTNTGNVTLKNITVEEMGGVVIDDGDGYTVDGNVATIASLSPENPSVVVKAHYVVTQEDVERGDLVNVATVKEPGTDVPKKPIVPVPTEDPIPAVAITKTTTSKSADAAGYALDETITYAIKATNTGNMILDNVVITDAKTGDTWNVGTLMPGATTKEFSASYKVTQSDILTGSVENTAIVVGTPHRASKEELPPVEIQAAEEAVPGNDTVTDSATVTDPTVKPSSAIQVTKTVTSQGSTITVDGKETTGYRVGDTIEFNIHVENIGNITVNNIVVNDVPTLSAGSPNGQITIQAGDGYTVNESTATIATLAPKASVDIKASYLVIAGDGTLNGNELSNAAFATGTSEDPNNPQPGDSSKTDPVPIEPEPDDGNGAMEGSITVTKMITTSDGKTPTSGVNAAIKVGLYDNASFSGTPIAVNTITISNATSGNTVFNELDNTANTTYYVAELDANNQPIVAANAHLEGYGAPAYSDNCKNGINPTIATDTAATIINPLEALSAPEGGLEEAEDTTEKTTEKSSTTSDSSTSTKSSTAAKTGDDTNMMIYWLLLGMAVLAGCTAGVYRKRKER